MKMVDVHYSKVRSALCKESIIISRSPCKNRNTAGSNFMALLTVSRELFAYVKRISWVRREHLLVRERMHSSQLAQNFGARTVSGDWWLQAQNWAVSRAMELGPCSLRSRARFYAQRTAIVQWADSFWPQGWDILRLWRQTQRIHTMGEKCFIMYRPNLMWTCYVVECFGVLTGQIRNSCILTLVSPFTAGNACIYTQRANCSCHTIQSILTTISCAFPNNYLI